MSSEPYSEISAAGTSLPAMAREDGLTEAEGEVMDALCEAVAAWEQLEKQHPSEAEDFYAAIHRAQDLLAVRIARRHYPEGWVNYTAGVELRTVDTPPPLDRLYPPDSYPPA